jgi:Fe-Mn family superoxide dismutase
MFYRKPLTYQLDSLRPFIDTETMNEHYNVHYKKYTDNLNAEIEKDTLGFGMNSLESILKNYKVISKKLKDNAGGFYNHLLYFENISPFHRNYYEYASEQLQSMINQQFGSYESFKEQFSKAGLEVFGSGWCWLIVVNDKLLLATTSNQDNPVMSMDCKVLLGMDVWEHAYYLKHLADRKSYVNDFFQTIDWKVVSDRLLYIL